jgi:hypothetical protein
VDFSYQPSQKASRSDLVTFLSVANRGWVTAAKDVPIAAQYTIDNYAPQLNFDYQNQSLKMICELVWAENTHTSAMTVETWTNNAKSFRKTHPEESLPAMEQWTDFSLALEAVDGR